MAVVCSFLATILSRHFHPFPVKEKPLHVWKTKPTSGKCRNSCSNCTGLLKCGWSTEFQSSLIIIMPLLCHYYALWICSPGKISYLGYATQSESTAGSGWVGSWILGREGESEWFRLQMCWNWATLAEIYENTTTRRNSSVWWAASWAKKYGLS